MAYPFRSILCPIQFDPNMTQTLRLAAKIAKDHDGTLHLVHVVTLMVTLGEEAAYGCAVDETQDEVAKHELEEIASKELSGAKYDILTRAAVSGRIPRAVVDAAAETNADLIIMATHGRSGLPHLFMGSVTEEVVRAAPCPVLTVRPAEAQ